MRHRQGRWGWEGVAWKRISEFIAHGLLLTLPSLRRLSYSRQHQGNMSLYLKWRGPRAFLIPSMP